MAALTQERGTTEREGSGMTVPVAATAKIYRGALVVANAGGFAAPGSAAANLTALGRAEANADNTAGANGAINVPVKRGVFKFDNKAGDLVTQALIGKDCYIEDDQTVRATAAGTSRAGKVIGIDATDGGVWVEVGR